MMRATRFESGFRSFAALAVAALIWWAPAEAQTPGIMSPGDTIVTGFSGVVPPAPPFAGDPIDGTFINLDGASMQIQRPTPLGPPQGQLIGSPTLFEAPASAVGQVFAITLDDQPMPNIFLGATSAFGIQIVGPDSNGDGLPDRLKTGQADATFMDGQWGPGGAPGSIYRVDGTTGAITLFTTIGANSGAGLGDVVFDKATHQLFVSDLDTGVIWRLDWTGAILDTFDHGLNGRPAHGLAPVPDDGSTMNITDPGFNAEDPATWGYTQKERMVYGMAVHSGRLYYAVADGPQVWSVGINLDGSFASDARWELDVTGLASANPISDMIFDGSGRMIVAQRGPQVGSYDYTVFAEPQTSQVVRYRREIPDDPTTPSTWIEVPDQYAIGFRPDGNNATGGVALGYGYDQQGRLYNGACFQMLWSSGDSLRDNPALAAQLAAGGPAVVHGLQGNDVGLVRPDNDPPFFSYFTDYDNNYDDPQNQGHVGDVEIWQPCDGYTPPYFPPPIYVPPPRDTFNLTLEKRGYDCFLYSDAWYCNFTVRVSNTGTTPYWGPVTVEDWLPSLPAGAVMNFAPQPPWLCGAIGPDDYSCTYPPVFLLPGDGVDLFVSVKLPPQYKPCSLDNAARIVWPVGWGDANPGDDFAFASDLIPGKQCEPPKNPKTNLWIQKSAKPKVCDDDGSNWLCSYLVTVTNTGLGVYSGPIQVSDTLSSGTPLTWSFPWSCVPSGPSWVCDHPPVVLNVGSSVFLWVTTSISMAAQVDAEQCSISNKVHITQAPGGSPQNTDPGDDDASDEALTPGKNCEPIGKQSDLSLKKESLGCTPFESEGINGWLCGFSIMVTNEGPDDFFAPLTIHDTMSPFPAAPWPWFSWAACTPDGGGSYTCPSGVPVFLPAHTSLPAISVVTFVPDDGETCHIKNDADIAAPLGGPLNTDASNDSSPAVLDVSSPACQRPQIAPAEKLCPIQSKMPGGGCCPDDEAWNGRSCGNTPPLPCPPNTTGTYPNCTPITIEKPKCPDGYTGIYPRCVKKTTPKCPDGYSGKYPNCVKIVPRCPSGYTGKYPNCVKIVQKCPEGYRGTYPNCVKIVQKCPDGTTGTYPRCIAIETPHCPTGYTGKYPNCVPAGRPCPQGYTGIFPNCKVNETGGGNTQGGGTTTRLPTCPKGTTGIYPLCIPNPDTQVR